MTSRKNLWRTIRKQRDELEKWQRVARASYYIALCHATSAEGLAKAVDDLVGRFTPDQLKQLVANGVYALQQLHKQAEDPLQNMVPNDEHQPHDEQPTD